MKEPSEDGIREYYDRHCREAEAWRKLLDYAVLQDLPPAVLKKLERELEAAQYAGD